MYVLKKIGIPIVEHCNLNCKGCLHFCNVKQKCFYYDRMEYESDIKKLIEIFDSIEVIRVYGGEPLLHPDLVKILDLTRKYFTNSKIELLTNGLLLSKMSEQFYECIKNNNINIIWSIYPVEKFNEIEIENKLISEKIQYKKNVITDFYGIFNPYGNSNPNYQWKRCSGRECHVLRKGYISACPAPAVEHIINDVFNQQLNFITSKLNIYDKNINAKSIIDFLEQPHDVCRYCSGARRFIWEKQNNPIIEDWYGKRGNDEFSLFSN